MNKLVMILDIGLGLGCFLLLRLRFVLDFYKLLRMYLAILGLLYILLFFG